MLKKLVGKIRMAPLHEIIVRPTLSKWHHFDGCWSSLGEATDRHSVDLDSAQNQCVSMAVARRTREQRRHLDANRWGAVATRAHRKRRNPGIARPDR